MANEEDDPFPMLQLPLTMKDMVLPKLSVLDLYNLSHVSDDAKNWVKDYVRNKNYWLKIDVYSDYEISLLNSDNQRFDVTSDSFDGDANYEFYFGDLPVLARKEVIGPNRMKIRVLTKRLDAQWDQNEAMKSFIAHLSDVFTKDVCIRVYWHEDQKEKIIMDSVEALQLNVHCFESNRKYSWTKIQQLPKCKRMCIDGENINARQIESLFKQWMRNGTIDYFEVNSLPKEFNIDDVMRGQDYITAHHRFHVNDRNYSVTRADGVTATVTFTPGYNEQRTGWRLGVLRSRTLYVSPKFVIRCETDQQCSTYFQTN